MEFKSVAGKSDIPHGEGSFTPAGTTSRRTMLAVALSYDGKFLATGGMDRRVHIWDTATGAHLVAFPGHKDIVSVRSPCPTAMKKLRIVRLGFGTS